MGASRRISWIAWLVVSLVALPVQAKRAAPKPVAPVTAAGVIYSASGDGVDQYVVARDASSGRELWKVKVFHTRIMFWMEPDVQLVFITDLKLMGKSLLVRDERSRCYSIGLARRRVRRHECGSLFSQ
jgi:hypothetical protein